MKSQDEILMQYLLGELPEEQQLLFEETYFKDDELYERLMDIEDELIRLYLLNELPESRRLLFEKHILSRPWKREKIKLSQALMAYTRTQRKPEPSSLKERIRSLVNEFIELLNSQATAVKWAYVTAMLLMVAGSSWLFLQTHDIRTQLAQVENERFTLLHEQQSLQRQVDAQQVENDALREQLQKQQNRLTELEKAPSGKVSFLADIITTRLAPGVLRDSSGVKKLRLTKETRLLQLELLPENAASFIAYRAYIETPEGDTLLAQYRLPEHQTTSGKLIILSLPATVLPPDDYIISLYGVTEMREFEMVGTYFLRVARE